MGKIDSSEKILVPASALLAWSTTNPLVESISNREPLEDAALFFAKIYLRALRGNVEDEPIQNASEIEFSMTDENAFSRRESGASNRVIGNGYKTDYVETRFSHGDAHLAIMSGRANTSANATISN